MTNTELYQRCLQDAGLSAEDAARVAKLRTGTKPSAATAAAGRIAVEAKKDQKEAEILIYDFIGFDFWSGDGITPQWLVDRLEEAGNVERIRVRVNSPGGNVFDAFAIYNILRRQEAKVSVDVEGLAASAASLIIQASDPGELRVAESSMLMIHRSNIMAMANKNDLRETADILEKLDGQIAGVYATRTGVPASVWLAAMDEETWYTGAEAVQAKLADSITAHEKPTASIDPAALGTFKNAPPKWVERVKAAGAEREEGERREREAEAVRVRMRALELDAA